MTQTIFFEDLVDVKIDNRGKTPPLSDNGYPLLEVNAISSNKLYPDISKVSKFVDQETYDTWFRQHLQMNDILFTTVGTIAESAIIPENSNATVAQNILGFRFKPEVIDPLFALYLMRSRGFLHQIGGRTIETVQKSIKWADMRGIKINLPRLDIQKKIADILGTIDEKIELNRRMNVTLEQMGQALFKHYFLTSPEAKTWAEKSLDEVADFLNGLAVQKYPKVEGEPTLPVIKIREMSAGVTANTDISAANIPEKYVVNNGDLLFSWSGTLIVKFWAEGKGALNQHLFKVTSSDYPEWFYYFWLQYHLAEFIDTAKSKATTMGHIQRHHLHDAKVRMPHNELLEKMNAEFSPLLLQLKNNQQEIQTLTTLRDTLLPRLISEKVKL
jgi:type I restriction enzyme S subunit